MAEGLLKAFSGEGEEQTTIPGLCALFQVTATSTPSPGSANICACSTHSLASP